MLQDHEFFLHCDPHMIKFAKLTPETPPEVPEGIEPFGDRGIEVYEVTDLVHTVPAGIWDSNVVSRYEFIDLADGLHVRLRSPLSIVMDTVWTIREKEGAEGAQLELVEDITIRCSRLLVGLVKSQCESGWAKIHAKMLARLTDEGKGGAAEEAATE